MFQPFCSVSFFEEINKISSELSVSTYYSKQRTKLNLVDNIQCKFHNTKFNLNLFSSFRDIVWTD
jgi:hypothetical protein